MIFDAKVQNHLAERIHRGDKGGRVGRTVCKGIVNKKDSKEREAVTEEERAEDYDKKEAGIGDY